MFNFSHHGFPGHGYTFHFFKVILVEFPISLSFTLPPDLKLTSISVIKETAFPSCWLWQKWSSQNCSERFETARSSCCFFSCIPPLSLYPSRDFPSCTASWITSDCPPGLVLPFWLSMPLYFKGSWGIGHGCRRIFPNILKLSLLRTSQ